MILAASANANANANDCIVVTANDRGFAGAVETFNPSRH